ncbi:MAG: mechanosensitive ion channel family protein [Hyphomicrobiales bacterium]
MLLGSPPSAAQAQTEATKPPPKVEELLSLLADPDVQKWIDAQHKAGSTADHPVTNGEDALASEKMAFEANLDRIKKHLLTISGAIPDLPQELGKAAGNIESELAGFGLLRVLLLFVVFVAAGLAAQLLFWWATAALRAWIDRSMLDTIHDRLLTMLARLVYGAGSVAAFALGSVGAFLVFEWPPRLRQIMLAYLLVAVIYRSARVMLDFIMSPANLRGFSNPSRFRVLPVSDDNAVYWSKRLGVAVGWYAFGWVTVSLLATLGLSEPARQLTAYALGAVLLLIGIEAIWRQPHVRSEAASPARVSTTAGNWLLTVYFALLWLLWVDSAMRLFWLLAVVVGIPYAVSALRKAVNNVLRAPGSSPGGSAVPSLLAAVVERGLRAALIIAAIVFLAGKLGIDFTAMTAQDTVLTRVLRGALSAIVILLTADFLWHIIRTIIESKIVEASQSGETGTEAARRKDRIRTLLPIARNFLMITIAVVALLMALSSLGVEIGPLIAGAGILGVAIGFGAQTVVKDIISGVFYLLDDAFRVGEYIQSGSYKGTVESFSLRSVKLRHQRGSIYTVPFSDLGAIQNMSRDWAIEKITISITYDSDVDKARKIVKKIGLDLAQDPEFKASTIEPLKMQGIDAFGDSGLMLRMKLMTRPGEQFVIKRRALMLIKQAFDANGIKIAVPTVQVAGEADARAAAANQAVLKLKTADITSTDG